jgi:hypothetical protein
VNASRNGLGFWNSRLDYRYRARNRKPKRAGSACLPCWKRIRTFRYVLVSAAETDSDDVTLALAIRGLGTCELAIPKAKYDPLKLLKLIEEETGCAI